jgi:hypothetical protein
MEQTLEKNAAGLADGVTYTIQQPEMRLNTHNGLTSYV